MDRNRAQAMLDEARAELATAESAISYLRQVVQGLEGLLRTAPLVPVAPAAPASSLPASAEAAAQTGGAAGSDEPMSYPRPSEAVLTVLRSRPNLPMEFRQVWADMNARGLVNPDIKSGRNAYTNSAQRLANDSEKTNVYRLDDGRYVFRTAASDGSPTTHQPGEAMEEVSEYELEVLTS